MKTKYLFMIRRVARARVKKVSGVKKPPISRKGLRLKTPNKYNSK